MTTRLRNCIVFSTILLLASGLSVRLSADTTLYRWSDERGNPVHSDRPPPAGTDYEVVEPGSTLVRQVDGDIGAVPREAQPSVGNKFEQVETRPKGKSKNSELCRRARKNLRDIDSAEEVKLRDNQGNLRTLSAEEVEFERGRASDAIAVHC